MENKMEIRCDQERFDWREKSKQSNLDSVDSAQSPASPPTLFAFLSPHLIAIVARKTPVKTLEFHSVTLFRVFFFANFAASLSG